MKIKVTRELDSDGYVIHNIVYETRPGLWVSANLYLPKSIPDKMPGIIISHAHHTPKTHGELQDMGMTWARSGVAVLVPDQRDDGTPVLSVPTHAGFAFAYGPESFRRHLDAARSVGLAVRVVRDPELAFDVDTVDDLREVSARAPELLPPELLPIAEARS